MSGIEMQDSGAIDLETLLDRINWTKTRLARSLGCDEKTVRQMAAGTREIPAVVARYLRALERWHAHAPVPPAGWLRSRASKFDEAA